MTSLNLGLALILIVTIMMGLIRVLRGPTAADRMLAAQLFGTTSVAILLLLAEAMQAPSLQNVALVLALLAAVATIAFIRHIWSVSPPER
ncbi:monovalent cation/H+ antiporter complex subunit F [Nitrosococcus watsonii]|uniref:Multiple resistance and pH regulation protein F n=1 Tax=Nitrosococcus watsoni (strain C-113) TaxID=105559 RepID=D8K5D2_NITWC|nr:monovalent cation/H+ antiporter complex subunit F [Nitrosococcus watsonii]ADJ28109.1 multiple resistance and pH regulation protein F [Nitrosococcus watsonii C-113]